jgi:hypothetical protein
VGGGGGRGGCKSFQQVINLSQFFCSFSSPCMFSGKTLYQLQRSGCGVTGQEIDLNSLALYDVTEDKPDTLNMMSING